MERVTVLQGELPVLVVSPHGHDDSGTAEMAEVIAQEIDAYAVINRGWQRAEKVDYWKDKANCNDIRHLMSDDVLQQEFLDPIIRAVTRIQREYNCAYLFILHGISDMVRHHVKDNNLDIIIGYGAGEPPSYSCDPRLKDAFIYYLQKNGLGVYEGSAGGPYSGRAKNNLNQLFLRWYPINTVHSMQVEVVKELRDLELVQLTGETIASCIDDILDFDDTTNILINAKQF
jgi:hypothetical protein